MWPFSRRLKTPAPASDVQVVRIGDSHAHTVRPYNSHLLHGRVISNTYRDDDGCIVFQTELQRVRLEDCTGLTIEPLPGVDG